MGHIVNAEREHRLLRQQMNGHACGVPDSPAILAILKILYTEEEAALARQVPTQPISLKKLAERLNLPDDEVFEKMTEMSQRGLMLDIEKDGQRYYALPPVLGGIFEFVMMRARDEVPMKELARLFDEYMNKDSQFGEAVYGGEVQFARTFVREETLPEGDHAEVLDWERITRLVETASAVSVGLCACRHKNSHLGKACEKPQRTCISLNGGAETMIHSGISDRISAQDGLRIIEECKELGLAQIGDNVQNSVTFACNCCGCCCTLINGIRTFNIKNAIVSSSWIAQINKDKCVACGRCVGACPVQALALDEGNETQNLTFEESLCLGCGVCSALCKTGGMSMVPRPQRVFTPKNSFDRTVRMAIERGKLAELMFADPELLSHRALSRILHALEKSPPWKAARAVKPLRSAFMDMMVKRLSR